MVDSAVDTAVDSAVDSAVDMAVDSAVVTLSIRRLIRLSIQLSIRWLIRLLIQLSIRRLIRLLLFCLSIPWLSLLLLFQFIDVAIVFFPVANSYVDSAVEVMIFWNNIFILDLFFYDW